MHAKSMLFIIRAVRGKREPDYPVVNSLISRGSNFCDSLDFVVKWSFL